VSPSLKSTAKSVTVAKPDRQRCDHRQIHHDIDGRPASEAAHPVVHTWRVHPASNPAVMTIALVVYSTLIFIGIALAVYYARRQRRGRAITAASIVGVLTVVGLVVAIWSAVS